MSSSWKSGKVVACSEAAGTSELFLTLGEKDTNFLQVKEHTFNWKKLKILIQREQCLLCSFRHLKKSKIIVALTTLSNGSEDLCPIWATFNKAIIAPVCENSSISCLQFNVIETMKKI